MRRMKSPRGRVVVLAAPLTVPAIPLADDVRPPRVSSVSLHANRPSLATSCRSPAGAGVLNQVHGSASREGAELGEPHGPKRAVRARPDNAIRPAGHRPPLILRREAPPQLRDLGLILPHLVSLKLLLL